MLAWSRIVESGDLAIFQRDGRRVAAGCFNGSF